MDEINALPFLTRKMLSFENGTTFGLSLTYNGPSGGTIEIRGITKEGFFSYKIPITSNNVSTTVTFGLPDIPVFISVVDSAGNMRQGQTFVELRLTLNGTQSYALCSGWVYKYKSISYPAIQNAETIPGRGNFNTIAPGSDPAVGQNLSYTFPTGATYRILGFRLSMDTSATVSNRRVKVGITFAGNDHEYMFSQVDQAASLTRNYYGGIQVSQAAAIGSEIGMAIPQECWAKGGDTFFSNVTNLQAGDQVRSLELLVESFINS